MPTPYMLEHRRRPHAYDTYTGGVPCLSSFRFEIGDFVAKDESGNALLIKWLSIVFTRFGPQDGTNLQILFNSAKKWRNKTWILDKKKKNHLHSQRKVKKDFGASLKILLSDTIDPK